MSLIGKISIGDYEHELHVRTVKLQEEIKKAILHNVWSYLYYNYGRSPLESDKAHCEAIHIISAAFNRKY